ncbi:DUF3833 domain-containing protein [Aliidiomarina taiwanensis]|uniref:DUF3833 domain-containing protein n=2 Tax=Aliidiomarina taiwanensis TaxID=946228 RepID=A0A432XAK9_9GAMM|nr:DUF3833 domain-containing protein [Aliidiomarina taiwanensis]
MQLCCVLVSLFLLAGCSAHIDDYHGKTPKLALEVFFDGSLTAYGMVQDRSGLVTQRFTVDIQGSWQRNEAGQLEGTLHEVFVWDDGREQTRTWLLTKVSEHQYEGRAGDVKGVAIGHTAGNALHWTYQLNIPWRGSTMAITLDDWMYLLDENKLVNKTKMSKWGFHLGDITIYMERHVY